MDKINRIIALSLFSAILFTMSSMSFAASNVGSEMSGHQELNCDYRTYSLNTSDLIELKKLGFDEKSIYFIPSDELNEIIENQYKFELRNEKNTLIISVEKINRFDNERNVETYSVELNQNEIGEYMTNKKEFMKKKYMELESVNYKKINSPIVTYDDFIIESLYSISGNVENFIDGALLTTATTVYDKSTTSYIEKRIGYDFQWDGVPINSFAKDAMAISHTGTSLGLVNIRSYGSSYTHYYGNQWVSANNYLTNNVSLYGITGNLQMTGFKGYGRIYCDIGNTKSSITPGAYFSVIGRYGHAITSTSISVGIGLGTISFTPTSSTLIKLSGTSLFNNILTY